VVLDDGAVQALLREGKSLLPIGVTEVEGEFGRGDVVACVDGQGRECARGLINYSSADTRRILRQPSSQIARILGSMTEPELMHRDNLVVL
jgi:glutamate 5-kinase